MNKLLLLLVIIGLGVAGYLHRDQVSAWFGHKSDTAESAPAAPAAPAAATVNPAQASRDQATKLYPALVVQGSPFNIRFVANFNQVKSTNPTFLTQSDWPMQLATRTGNELGISPVAPVTPAPVPFGSSLDNHAYGGHGGATPPPTPGLLPGLTGSALDEKPKSGRGH
jgi:hypothetical protein